MSGIEQAREPTATQGEGEMASSGDASTRPRTSSRDRDRQRARLADWLARYLSEPEVSELSGPPTTGMSSETLLFDVTWAEDGRRRTASMVARVAPDLADVPVFPTYDMDHQFQLIQVVERGTSVPVPHPRWFEPDESHLGAPFFIMDRVEGQVPPDLMPYTFGDNWLFDASAEEQRLLQDSSVQALAELHALDGPREAPFLAEVTASHPGGTALRRHVGSQQAYYQWVVRGHERSPLIERGFRWLDEHWPADEGPARLSWGDARIGNVMYRDFRPVAVLDFEMAALGPAEIDLGWFIYLHRFFQDLTEQAGLPGMPGFLRRDEVAATYEQHSGRTPRDLDFYMFYAALRHAIVMTRVTRRQIHFGEAELPADPDDLIIHRPSLEAMLAGTYWSGL
jgi:aminoglycoside phosphotransferase (APT) family kinase protein